MIKGNKRITTNFYLNPDKEEAWLNRWAKKGWAVSKIKFGGLYIEMEKTQPQEYEYCIEFLSQQKKTEEYLAFLGEVDVECIYHLWGIAYFRKKADDTPFEIYTDPFARISELKKRRTLLSFIAGMMCLAGVLMFALMLLLLFFNQTIVLSTLIFSFLYLGLSGSLLYGILPYNRRILKLQKEIEASGEQEFKTNKKQSKLYPFLMVLIGFTVIGGIIGVAMGWMVSQL